MRALILAAGQGTRLKPITEIIPKAMIELVNKPMLEHIFDNLKSKGIIDFVVVVGYKKEMVEKYFGDGKKFGINIEYVEQEDFRGGTADAVKTAREKITDKKFILVYSDNVFDPNVIDEMVQKSKKFDGIICCKEVDEPTKYGILQVDGEKIIKILEKPKNPPTNLAMTGLFVLPKEIFSAIDETKRSSRGEYELTDSLQILIDKGMKFGYIKIKGVWIDIGGNQELEQAKDYIRIKK